MPVTSGRGEAVRRVRLLLHAAGYRFRTRARDLPGVPDIVLPGRRSVILVRGCAEVPGCSVCRRCSGARAGAGGAAPEGRAALERAGWRVLLVSECEAVDASLAARLLTILGPPPGRTH
ncbi:very short patch repair endonuclease [Acuticoccus kandeliae]|uniref:very short patch repair endonuclease n=1 Tax=Acuticoccus kandeliae TaxID=2073160 RepID=UPI001FEC9957|nr:very short patch repair endonuclease [Acuticoccus kandeliae]